MRWLFPLLALLVSAGCTPEIPDATYVCATTAECPPGLACDVTRGLCVREARLPDAGCTPFTCELLRAECGALDDGCGGTLSCGTCTAPETCGGDGLPNVCGCTPLGCEALDCGIFDNGCSALMNCGDCDLPLLCGLEADEPNRCGCKADDPCEANPKSCGDQVDTCGIVHTCPECVAPETCGAGGPNLCGEGTCTPTTCAAEGKNCGTISDGCGAILDCGTCTAPATCGGGIAGTAAPNVCGCTPRTCETTTRPAECGRVVEECGTLTVDCGPCPIGSACEGNMCACAPLGEPPSNDVPAMATMVRVDSTRTSVTGQNLHLPTDVDFFAFQPSFSVLSGSGLAVTISVPGTLDLGLWVTCMDAMSMETACSAGSSYDTMHGTDGCVAPRTGSGTRTTVAFTVYCSMPTFIARVSGPMQCAAYDIVIDLVAVV